MRAMTECRAGADCRAGLDGAAQRRRCTHLLQPNHPLPSPIRLITELGGSGANRVHSTMEQFQLYRFLFFFPFRFDWAMGLVSVKPLGIMGNIVTDFGHDWIM